MKLLLSSFFNLPAIIPESIFRSNNWPFLLLGIFVFGIILGGLVKGLAKFVLSLILFGLVIALVMALLGNNDLVLMIISVSVGLITLLISFLAKLGKSYLLVKR